MAFFTYAGRAWQDMLTAKLESDKLIRQPVVWFTCLIRGVCQTMSCLIPLSDLFGQMPNATNNGTDSIRQLVLQKGGLTRQHTVGRQIFLYFGCSGLTAWNRARNHTCVWKFIWLRNRSFGNSIQWGKFLHFGLAYKLLLKFQAQPR